MDTRFWGPAGWRLLHLISFGYTPSQKESMITFLEALPYVLPCKYCRSSLITYYQELPPEKALANRDSLSRWMWKIHGKVNEKLRGQGQTIPPDPTYAMVKQIFTERLMYGCTKTEFPGWNFLFSIVENHPFTDSPVSMSNAPPLESIDSSDFATLLKWNYLDPKIRFQFVCQFWNSLPYVLPFAEWRTLWKQEGNFCEETWDSKSEALRGLWQIRKRIDTELNHLHTKTFRDLCNDLRLHRSGCGKSRKARTCRRKRKQ